jgi:hypothetical protein
MDASILQAAQRVMNWHLQHTVLPSPPAQSSDRSGDEDTNSSTDGQAESDSAASASSSRA